MKMIFAYMMGVTCKIINVKIPATILGILNQPSCLKSGFGLFDDSK